MNLNDYVQQAKRIVFFGGAGVSTASQIPDFRSATGLYQQNKYPYPAERMLSASFFHQHPKAFFDFYRHEMLYPDALPNGAHKALAKWECSKEVTVITQNIDGLHQMAGSTHVIELHGSVHDNVCQSCGRHVDLEGFLASFKEDGLPHCSCRGIFKPSVVLYEEGLDEQKILSAIQALESADLCIVGGTSLSVYPAAGLLQYYHQGPLVLINQSSTAYDAKADWVSHDPIADVLESVAIHAV